MNYPIVFMVVGGILVIWGLFLLTRGGSIKDRLKGSFLLGWRMRRDAEEKKREQKK